MREEKITIRIEKNTGIVNIETGGFVGNGCTCISDLEAELGRRNSYSEKEEMHQYDIPDVVPVHI